jgi:hypothetical protein
MPAGQLITLPVRIVARRSNAECHDITSAGLDASSADCDTLSYHLPTDACSRLSFTIRVHALTSAGDRVSEAIETSFRCRRITEPFVFTFLDHDGSVASTGVTAPLGQYASNRRSLPITLSLHGTGVSGQSQAEAYKYKTGNEKDYTFGVVDSWLITPDRHGAHNWEYTGHFTAMSAVAAFSQSLNSAATLALGHLGSSFGVGYGNSDLLSRSDHR